MSTTSTASLDSAQFIPYERTLYPSPAPSPVKTITQSKCSTQRVNKPCEKTAALVVSQLKQIPSQSHEFINYSPDKLPIFSSPSSCSNAKASRTLDSPFRPKNIHSNAQFIHKDNFPSASFLEGTNKLILPELPVASDVKIDPNLCRLESGKSQCPLCPRSYKHFKHLIRHLRKHTGYRPYVCSVCNDTFGRSDILKRHLNKCLVKTSNKRKKNAPRPSEPNQSTPSQATPSQATPSQAIPIQSITGENTPDQSINSQGDTATCQTPPFSQTIQQLTPIIADPFEPRPGIVPRMRTPNISVGCAVATDNSPDGTMEVFFPPPEASTPYQPAPLTSPPMVTAQTRPSHMATIDPPKSDFDENENENDTTNTLTKIQDFSRYQERPDQDQIHNSFDPDTLWPHLLHPPTPPCSVGPHAAESLGLTFEFEQCEAPSKPIFICPALLELND